MKLHLLDLGSIEYDEGFPLAGAGVSTLSEPNPAAARRKVAIIGALIEHPKIGPILFDTGAAPNAREVWPPIVFELFAITEYRDEQRLDNVLGAAGFGLDDVKAIVLSHMHLDHAGGLEFFAEIDLLCAISTCPSGDLSQWGWGEDGSDPLAACRPIGVEVYELDGELLEGWRRPESPRVKSVYGA